MNTRFTRLERLVAITLWLTVCILACPARCSAQAAGQAAKPAEPKKGLAPIKTWAVLGDKATMASGLTDALLAELSATDMQLVEREQLQQAVDEQVFQTLMSGQSAESRRLGKIVNADALIIVAHASQPGNNLRLIICECRQGLRIGELNIELRPVDQQALFLAKYIQDRRQQFAAGIHTIVGLAPLACRNIEHGFDHLQQRYFDMLTGRLMTIPGLALLEMPEARTIASEPGAGDQAQDRLLPIMVECEYRVAVEQNASQVQFKAQLTGASIETIDSPKLTFEQSTAWLGNELVEQILKRGRGKPLKLSDQQALLAQRADYLMRLGDLKGAVQCREAYLLAEPSSVEQRTAIIEDLLTLGNRSASAASSGMTGVRERTARLVEMAAYWTPIVLDHLAYLIENREVDQAKAIDLMGRMQAVRFLLGSYVHVVQLVKDEKDVRAGLDMLLSANRRFVLQTAAKVLVLDAAPSSTAEFEHRQLAAWQSAVMRMVADDIALNAGAMDSFRYLEQVILDRIPEELPTNWEVLNAIFTYRRSFSPMRVRKRDGTYESVAIHIEEEAMQAWLQRLAVSRHLHLRLYGRAIQLMDKLPTGEVALSTELQNELDQLITEMRARPQSQLRGNNGARLEALLDRLSYVSSRYKPQQATQTEVGRPPLPANDRIAGKMSIEKLNIKFPAEMEEIKDYIKTDQGVDIVVGTRVGVLKDDLSFSPIGPKLSWQDSVAWDGEHLWIAQLNRGISRYDLQGNLVGQLTANEGLPGNDVDLQVLAIQKNQLLVHGSIGSDIGGNRRCWLALVSVVNDAPQIKIIHEARQPYRAAFNPKDPSVPLTNDDLTMSFKLMWWNAVSINQRRIAFIGRQAAPLAVDIETGKVEVVTFDPTAAHAWGTVMASDGFLYKAYTTGVAQYTLPADNLQPLVQRRVIDSWLPNSAPLWANESPRLMEHEGWIYMTGQVWYRFRPDGSSVERLVAPETPRWDSYRFAAPSNHFGVVGWGSSNLYRVTLPK